MVKNSSLFKYHTIRHKNSLYKYDGYKEYVNGVLAKKRDLMIEYLSTKYDFDVIDEALVRTTTDKITFSPKTEIYISVDIKEEYDITTPDDPRDYDVVSTLGLTDGVDYYKVTAPTNNFIGPDGEMHVVQCQSVILNGSTDTDIENEILGLVNKCKSEGVRFVSYIDRQLVYDNEQVSIKCRFGKAPPGLFNPHKVIMV